MRGYESTHLYSTCNRRRANHHPEGIALITCVRFAPLPDPHGKRTPRTCLNYRPTTGLRRPDGAQCDHRLQHGRSRRAQEGFLSPHRLRTSIPDESLEPLRDLLHRSPREFGLARSLWSLPLAAKISFEQGLVPAPTTGASVRRALVRLGVRWKRARQWITSPDPLYLQIKRHVIG
jgi:hypothetical protein